MSVSEPVPYAPQCHFSLTEMAQRMLDEQEQEIEEIDEIDEIDENDEQEI